MNEFKKKKKTIAILPSEKISEKINLLFKT